MSEIKKLVNDTRRWVEQEKAWGGELYATTAAPRSPAATASIAVPSLIGRGSREVGGDATAKSVALQALYDRYHTCTRCVLGKSRIKFVFGVGNPDSEVLFIGEGPGYEEDRRGEPFVGKAGQLLDKMMAAIGLSRQTNAYIANIVKCHPMSNPETPDARGNDRPPEPEEVATCAPILLQQIAVIQPKVIMTLGSPSTKMILHTQAAITGLRGKLVPFDVAHFYPASDPASVQIDAQTRAALSRTQVLPTFHPAALLRNPNLKKDSWEDLKLLKKTLEG
jgi:uracil-DNA glycosylase family 4